MQNKTKTFFIHTYGCQMNKNDSEKITAILEHLGWEESTSDQEADFVLLNTCSVRDKAERRVLGKLGQLKHLRETKNPDLLIGVCGCMPQYQLEKLQKELPYVNLFFGTNNIYKLPQLIENILKGENTAEVVETIEHTEVGISPKRTSDHQAFITIMYGCNNFCSYCIVPYTRGREVSRKKEDIIKEIRELNKSEYPKIMLLGQNVNSYGNGLYEDYDFSDLLMEISQIEGLSQIDFLTSHPKDMSDKLIDTLAKIDIINKEFHFPLQAGDNDVLEKMNRKYTYEHYKNLVKKIRKKIPEAKISTDLIVGFPGETEEQFHNTLRAVREIGFFRVNTAAYSPRGNTPAAKMVESITPKEKAQRLQTLMSVIDDASASEI